MTLASFRVRLAVALGLPACTPTPAPTPPVTPPPAQPTASSSGKLVCAPDQVHEHLCGLVEADNTYDKAGAAPPFDRCPAHATDLDSLDLRHMIDGWLQDSK